MMGQHVPKRGDDIEAWIKQWRDRYDPNGSDRHIDAWIAADDMLDDYRLHADTGMPIDQAVTDWPGVRV